MEQLIDNIMNSFNIALMFSLIATSYITLKVIDLFVSKTHKVFRHIATAAVCLILCIIYYKYGSLTITEIIPTYLLSTAFYDVIVKKVLEKLNIKYKK